MKLRKEKQKQREKKDKETCHQKDNLLYSRIHVFMTTCQLLARRSHKPHPLIHKTTAPNAHHVYLRCDWLRGNTLCGLAKHLFKHP